MHLDNYGQVICLIKLQIWTFCVLTFTAAQAAAIAAAQAAVDAVASQQHVDVALHSH